MIKKLVKHGNSHALVIDQAILELLRIDPDQLLDLSTAGRSLIIAPVDQVANRMRVQKALQKVNRKYGSLLKKLAE